MDNANGPPDTGISACGVSLPLSASRLKAAILLSSCRQTYKEYGMVLISPGILSQALAAALYNNPRRAS